MGIYYNWVYIMNIHSSDIAFCTPDELFRRYDKRLIARLVSDTGVPISDDFALKNDQSLKVALREASAIVESYAYRGGRYTRDDLIALYQDTTKIGRELLIGLVASIALYLLWRRRGDPGVPIPNEYKLAEDMLRKLEQGYNIFAFEETMDTGRRVGAISNSSFSLNSYRLIALRRLTGNPFFVSE